MHRKISRFLITSALPYANGPLHLGHVAGAYLPADIFVRYQRMKGSDVVFICGTDEHGVPILIQAQQQGISPKALIKQYHKNIKESFQKLCIHFDYFSGTSGAHHHHIAQEFFTNLHKKGYLTLHTTKQLYCEHDKIFLPDRFVLGRCPHCHTDNARGDECPGCNTWIEAEELLDPKCKICGGTPQVKTTKHWYLQFSKFQDKLYTWISENPHLRKNIKEHSLDWIRQGLQNRAITRDLSWGVPVPLDDAEGKVLYVWFDAPIGYLSITQEWSKTTQSPERWKDYWLNPECQIIHCIGKDNIPFHVLFWPAILMGQELNYTLPYNIAANEHLHIEGKKLSTSEGNVIWVDDCLKEFPADYLRYYLTSIAPENKDTNFSWQHFQEKINAELNNTLGNFVNRSLTFLEKHFGGCIPQGKKLNDADHIYSSSILSYPEKVGALLEQWRIKDALHTVMELGALGNRYFDAQKPWQVIKTDKNRAASILQVCTHAIQTLAQLLYPFIPSTSERIWEMLGHTQKLSNTQWGERVEPTSQQNLKQIALLFEKIDDKHINNITHKQHTHMQDAQYNKATEDTKQTVSAKDSTPKPSISFEDFSKLELRVGTVLECEAVQKSKKLLKLQVNLGHESRQILSGIADHYKAEQLIGKQVVVVTNLAPRTLMGEKSTGMILCAHSGETLVCLSVEKNIPPGSTVS